MSLFYLDTSALVKRYVEEKGTDIVDELFEGRRPGESLAISVFAVLELKSALRRLANSRKVTLSQYKELIADFSRDARSISIVEPVDNALMEAAASILDRHPLRTGDAMHFASILRLKQTADGAGEALIAVSSDRELLDACHEEGISAFDPEDGSDAVELRGLRATF